MASSASAVRDGSPELVPAAASSTPSTTRTSPNCSTKRSTHRALVPGRTRHHRLARFVGRHQVGILGLRLARARGSTQCMVSVF